MAVTGGKVERFGSGAGLIITCDIAEAITAGNLVKVTGDWTVSQCDANDLVGCGVALQSGTVAGTDKIDVWFPGTACFDLVSSGSIAAGAYVKSGAAGVVVSGAADGDPRLIRGFAMAAAASNVCPVVIL